MRFSGEPVPPSPGGEPPMTQEFNRRLYGLVLPALGGLWALYTIFFSRRIRLPSRYGRGTEFFGADAVLIALIVLESCVLAHRIRFWYELYQSPPQFWKWHDQLLLGLIVLTAIVFSLNLYYKFF